MKNCYTCGGAVLEPNKNYGYAGPICYCIVPPKIQNTGAPLMSDEKAAREWIVSWHDLSPEHVVLLTPGKCWLSKAKGVNHVPVIEKAAYDLVVRESETWKLKFQRECDLNDQLRAEVESLRLRLLKYENV